MSNVVNVYSIDEERLRFRVICAIDTAAAGYDAGGAYDLDIPIPTSFTNSHEYSSCRIRCDTFTALVEAAATAVNQVWSDGAALRSGCVELQLSAPSSQTTATSINAAANVAGGFNQPNVESSGFKQLIPIQFVNFGGLGAGWASAAVTGGWTGFAGVRPSDAIICANPFGSRLRIRLVDPFSRNNVFLADTAGIGVDIGKYAFQFEIEMVPDK
jgi:hypothetical protein